MRLTEEQLKVIEERRKGWERDGKITTHLIAGKVEAKPANKRGGRKSKYGNIKTEAEGFTFASRKEKKRWLDLRLQERAGEIKDLQRQVVYPIEINGFKVCEYIADHVYERKGTLIVEDSKGYATEIFRLKAKLMRAVHGIEVVLS